MGRDEYGFDEREIQHMTRRAMRHEERYQRQRARRQFREERLVQRTRQLREGLVNTAAGTGKTSGRGCVVTALGVVSVVATWRGWA